MYLDWRLRLLVLCVLTGLYFMVSCLINVARLDARVLERRQFIQDRVLHTQRKYGARSFAGIMKNSESKRQRRNLKISWCSPLGFQSTPGPMVALASFPGSGNTWVRYLLQQATGVMTGSIYRDYALLKNGFPAENVANGSVLIVKTHEYGPHAREDFEKSILLVRDPFSSVLAEFNRRSGGHIGHASLEKFQQENGNLWKQFVLSKGKDWEEMNLDWGLNFSGPKLVVFYNQLVKNTEHQLNRILSFLNISITKERMKCVLQNKEGIYRRSKRDQKESLFDASLTKYLRVKQSKVFSQLKRLVSPQDL